jgi:acylphosphatase
LARGFDVSGYVRNLPNGRVELLIEGEPGELDRFIAAIQNEMGGFIREIVTEHETGGEPPLHNFTVRY